MSEKELVLEIQKFVKWSKKAGKYKLINCSSGNLSHRLKDGTILVSQSKAWLGNLKENQVVQIDNNQGLVIKGKQPTGELPLHYSVLSKNTEVNTVLHCQSVAATTLACSTFEEINYNVIIEVPIYIGKVAHLPFIMPGSESLANAVADASFNASVIQLQNHGQIIIGKNYKDTFQKAIFFEMACQIIVMNKMNHSSLTPDQVDSLKNYR